MFGSETVSGVGVREAVGLREGVAVLVDGLPVVRDGSPGAVA